ncbi:MAG: glycosyltransferase [Myxococcota bacterium]
MNPTTTVVHIITRLELGGAQENTLYTCEHLDKDRFRVILAYGPGGLLDDRARSASDFTCWEVPELIREVRPRADINAWRHLKRRLQAEHKQHCAQGGAPGRFIVHTHSSKAGIVGRWAAAAARVPLIIHGIHGFGFHQGQHPLKRGAFVSAEIATARVTHGFFSVSHASLEEARERRIVHRGHFARVIRSGMDLGAFTSKANQKQASRRQLDVPQDGEVIVSIANFKPQKDPLTMIRAFHEVARRRSRAILLFAGDGPLRAEVEAAVMSAGLGERVRLLGWRRDIPELLACADVVALSSIFEGLPRSAVQAVAARRPFVGTRVDGTPEIIREGKNGFLVPPQNPAALASAIESALDMRPLDPADVDRVQAWSTSRMVSDQQEAYASLLSHRTEIQR